MQKRICWKKGMRLTDEVLTAADNCTAEMMGQTLMLASAGRYGLMPSQVPFQLSMNIVGGEIEITFITLLAITRAGEVIDLELDNDKIGTLNNKLRLPSNEEELFLTINCEPGKWTETDNGYLQPHYSFALITPQAALSDHAIPISHLVNNNGWQEDTTRFLPPYLYVSASPRLEEVRAQLVDVLKNIHEKTKAQENSPVKTAISIYWPIVLETLIQVNATKDTLTPSTLLACIQKVVGIFALACELDEVLNLEDAPVFFNFSEVGYNFQTAYLRLKQGVGMCRAINEKIDKFSLLAPAPKQPTPPPPPQPEQRRNWLGKQI